MGVEILVQHFCSLFIEVASLTSDRHRKRQWTKPLVCTCQTKKYPINYSFKMGYSIHYYRNISHTQGQTWHQGSVNAKSWQPHRCSVWAASEWSWICGGLWPPCAQSPWERWAVCETAPSAGSLHGWWTHCRPWGKKKRKGEMLLSKMGRSRGCPVQRFDETSVSEFFADRWFCLAWKTE